MITDTTSPFPITGRADGSSLPATILHWAAAACFIGAVGSSFSKTILLWAEFVFYIGAGSSFYAAILLCASCEILLVVPAICFFVSTIQSRISPGSDTVGVYFLAWSSRNHQPCVLPRVLLPVRSSSRRTLRAPDVYFSAMAPTALPKYMTCSR